MKKKDKIQDSPEFKQYKADFEYFVKGMEEDKEYADLKMPDGWEQDFDKTIDDTLDGNERKQRHKIIKRIVGVAAAVVVLVTVGNFTAESVSGEGLLEMFMNKYFVGEQKYDIYGTNNEVEFDTEQNQNILYFSGETLEEVNQQICEEIKAPMFYLTYLPDGFTVKEAFYDKEYRIIDIKLILGDEYIYIFQQKQVDDTASGIMAENIEESKDESFMISNTRLGEQINILESYQDNSWLFNVRDNNDVLTINTSISKEECIKIAENIDYY